MITKESSSLVDSKKDGAPQPPILQLEEPSTQLSNQAADDSGILTNPGDQISLQELNKNNGGGDESSRPTTSPQTASTQVASNRQLLGLEAEDDQSSAVQPSSMMTATTGTVLNFKSVMGQWIHVHRKFTLESNFQHFTEFHFTSLLCCEFPVTRDSHEFSNFPWYHTELKRGKWKFCGLFSGQIDEGRDKEPPASGPPQNSKFEWPLLFERASKNWWHPQFDSHILEQQYWKSLLPRTTKRFRFGLFYLAFMSGICCMYYGLMAVDEWLTFFLIFLLVFIAVIIILILTFVKEYFYRNHCFKISLSKYCKLD